ncbi:MAG: translocation/assembly module TamB domain-containing protein, partial [Sphingomonadales bacterium]|nr:translocation/assembly module TamB domain-containing protein [Sphingomonadales bacterium]
RLDGGFTTAGFTYLLTAPQAAFGNTGVTDLRVGGEGRISELPFRLPLSATASRVTGVGETADEILRNVRIEGAVLVTDRQIVAEDLAVRSDRLRGQLSVIYDLATGRYQVGLDGAIDGYHIPGLGTVDLRANVEVRPGPGGRFYLTGRARGIVRSLENATVANLAGGLPTFDANIAYGADGRFGFTNLRIRAPDLNFAGRGHLAPNGTIEVTGSGSQAQYGVFRVAARGNPSRPHLDLALANPLPSAGISDVDATLTPIPAGYAYAVTGDSMAGPFSSNGEILLPSGAPVAIAVDELLVAEILASGRLTLADAGIVGSLGLTGQGIAGTIGLDTVNGVQAIHVDLEAENAELGGEIATSIRQATVELDALLYPEAPEIVGRIEAFGVRRRGVSLARVEADINLIGGRGTVDAEIAGARGREFEFAASAEIAPDMITVTGGGSFEGDPITLTPLRVTRTDRGWRVAESTIEYAGGGATVSGLVGGPDTEFSAMLDNIPLSVVDIFLPETGLGGIATGRLVYNQPEGRSLPYVDAELRIRSLTREGFAIRPRPVNLGINARLDNGLLAARGIMESEGEEIMRGQVRIDSIDEAAGLSGLAAAPLFAELRYSGPVETIWQLTGNELLSISGPMLGRADARGTLNNPEITGEIATENARLESALTGTVVEGITTEGRFAGSTFNLPNFSGNTSGGGTISGTARFDLGLASGLGMDVQLQAERALLLNRDDIEARVTGPLSITLQTPPGTLAGDETARPVGRIEGDLTLVEGEFALGQAAPSAAIPQLNVVEINRRLDEPDQPPPPIEWTLEIDVDADNRFNVVGLGLDSEWAADLEVRGSIAEFRIFGDMDLVRGAYSFAGKRFELERGRIDFYGNVPINPALDIVAEGGVEGLQATINIGGNALDPEIRLASVPALPESELLSRLLFGTSITNLSAFEAIQLAAAVASLQG